MTHDELRKAVEEIVFYGTGDEAYEDWQKLCRICYELANSDARDTDRAEIVLVWIRQDAEHSKEWCEDQFGSLDEVDKENGVWEGFD